FSVECERVVSPYIHRPRELQAGGPMLLGDRLKGSSLEPRGMSHVMRTVVPSLCLKPTSVQEVTSVIRSLKPGHSVGSGGISSNLLKDVAEQLALPLAHIANATFESGVFPCIPKQAVKGFLNT
ncbi:hypothetical protein J6590_105411, partial [Homalodisca vitripennis]